MNKYGNNPLYGYLWKFVMRTRQATDIDFLRPAYSTAVSPDQIRNDLTRFQSELANFAGLRKTMDIYKTIVQTSYADSVLNSNVWLALLYFLIRIKKPATVIETGCASGTTSSLMLYALEQNKFGHLYSIDMRFPSDRLARNNLSSGFLIPDEIKSRWTLILRDAKIALPELLSQLGQVDFFYHDSDHTFVHQMWEYLSVWPYLSLGGILASDDISHNTALFDLGRQVPEKISVTNRQRNFGMIVKAHALESDVYP